MRYKYGILFGGLEHEFDVSIQLRNVKNKQIPTDELIFFRGVGIPPTSDVICWNPVSHTLIA